MLADVRFFWTPSVSDDVIGLSVGVTNDDTGEYHVLADNLSPETTEYVAYGLKEKVNYTVSVVVFDGTNRASASQTFNLGDLSVPLPVSNLGFEVVKVYNA